MQSHQQTFEEFLEAPAQPRTPPPQNQKKKELRSLEPGSKDRLRQRIEQMVRPVTELDASLLVSATYDGEKRLAVLKFYDPAKNQIFLWQDNTNHKPYAFSKEPRDALLRTLGKRTDVISINEVGKYEPLSDSDIKVSQIVTTDPLAIGGGQNSIRDQIQAWEADIKYYENYIYDKGYLVGTYYRIRDGKVESAPFETPKEVHVALEKTLANAKPEMKKAIAEWAALLNQPLPYLKRVALDIEVLSAENRIPNPDEAIYPIVAVSLVSKDLKRVYLLDRPETELGNNELPDDAEVRFYKTEADMIIDLFTDMLDYPFVATFNGDDFDLNYLYHRAQRGEVGLSKAEIPIALGNKFAGIKYGVHIDLYKTFNNKSLQIYAFGNKYSDKTLNGIAEALLGKSKIEFDGLIGDLPIYELARYNLWDTVLTYELVSIYNDVLMKLLVAIARVGKMPIDDLSRLGVSNWIRSMLYYEHRRQNALIPRSEELERKGGARSEAIIKGKKYKGGLVIDPVSGVHFNVSVLDFASLYPSIIKVYNISYETIDCPHPECRKNIIPEVGTWYCTKRQGIESLVVGSLRDLRVEYYKQLTRSKTLSQGERDLYKIVSQSLKVILNASYGVLGFESFPLYCLPAAEAVATLGRYSITKTIEKCKELGIQVVYSDTDSIFLQTPSEEQIAAVTAWTQKNLGIDLEVDKVYRYVAMSERKKNYFGVLSDGSVDLKGLTGKKSQTPQFIKNSFYKTLDILTKVKTKDDFDTAREEIKALLKSDYSRLKERQITMQDLAFNVMIGKDISRYKDSIPQHVRAAQLLQQNGADVKAGDIISFVKTISGDGAKPAKLAKPGEVDVDKYLEYMKSTFDQILGSLGYDFDEILGAMKLEDFFWGSS